MNHYSYISMTESYTGTISKLVHQFISKVLIEYLIRNHHSGIEVCASRLRTQGGVSIMLHATLGENL